MKYLMLILLLVVSCSSQSQKARIVAPEAVNAPVIKSHATLPKEYFNPLYKAKPNVQVGDILEVSIFGHADTMENTIQIAPDGKLYYQFGISVWAKDKSLEEISTALEAKLDKLFNNPEVSVLPVKQQSNRFSVLGKVRTPGEYSITTAITLRQAITQAGGLRDGVFRGTTIKIASLKQSFIIRDNKRLPIDFLNLVEKGDSTQDIYVMPGDYIYIASGLSLEVYIFGAVRDSHPAAYNDGMTLIGLLSEQGRGPSTKAYLKKIVILRGPEGKMQHMEVDLAAILNGEANDIYLQPGDIIYIPDKPYQFFKELVILALNTFTGRMGSHYATELIK